MSNTINTDKAISYAELHNEGNLNTVNLKPDIKANENVKPKLNINEEIYNAMALVPEVSDGYVPPFSNKYTNNDSIDQENFNNVMSNLGVIALDLLPLLQAKENSMKILVEVQNSFIMILDQVSKDLMDYANNMVKFLESEHLKQVEELKQNSFKAAIAGFFSGIVEVVLGVIAIAAGSTTGGVSSVVGVLMIVNGLAKAGAGIAGMADPDLVTKGPAGNIMQNGIFAVLGSAAAIVQQVMSIIMLFGGSVEGFVKCIADLGLKSGALLAFNVVNMGTISYGMINTMINANTDQSKHEFDDSDKLKQMAAMGILALVVAVMIQETGATKAIKEKSDIGAMIFEMLVTSAASFVGNWAIQELSSSIPTPESIAKSKLSLRMNDFMRWVGIENNINMATSSVQLAVKSAGIKTIEEEQAFIELTQQITQMIEKIIQQRYQSTEQVNDNSINPSLQEIGKSVETFVKSLKSIINKDAHFYQN